MRTVLKWIVRAALALVLAALVVGIWKREEITRLLAVNSLFAEDHIVGNFSNMRGAFLTRPVSRGEGPVTPLPEAAAMDLPDGTDDWIAQRAVTSLLVLKEGAIRHESYHLGTGPEDLRISWSVAKSFLSVLVGILIDKGAIEGLDIPVTRHAPQLVGTAYDGATLRDVLHMASGIAFNEDYLDASSDINRMGRVLALGGTMDDFTTALSETVADPGADWHYVSIDTHVVGMVIRGATGRDIASLMSEHVIAPLGLEAAPYYLTDGVGTAFVLGGLNLTTRDYARFGLMAEQAGRIGDTTVAPEDWMRQSVRATAPTDPGQIGYGLHWWVPEGASEGEFMARGVYGQYIYVDRIRDVVIVTTAADRAFREPGVGAANVAMFRRLAAAA